MRFVVPQGSGADYYRITADGRYTLAKTFQAGTPYYEGWCGRNFVVIDTDKAAVIAALDQHAEANQA